MQRFNDLIDAYCLADTDAAREGAGAALWSAYGVEATVLVLDMSGFSRLTLRHGILHYLALVRRMQTVTRPLIARHGGQVVKFEADNCYATFDEPGPAVEAALAFNRVFSAMNVLTPDDRDIHVCIGIDHGRFLLVPGHDLFGNPVNFASKLGEDLADISEVLVSEAAFAKLGTIPGARFDPITFSIGGVSVAAHRVVQTA